MEALFEGCVGADSRRPFLVRQVSLVHSVIRILCFFFFAQCSNLLRATLTIWSGIEPLFSRF